MTEVSKEIIKAYSPENFARVFEEVSNLVLEYFQTVISDKALSVLPPVDPQAELLQWNQDIPQNAASKEALTEILKKLVSRSNHLHSPRYVGHQVCAPLPLAALMDMIGSLLNNGMAVYEMGPAITAIENKVVAWMCKKLGWPQGYSGIMTSGGSIGNLTALLAARQAKAGYDCWKEGNLDNKFTVLVSDQAHYCVRRAVQIMGWGEQGATLVATDDDFRMDMNALEAAYEQAKADGKKVIAVVASGCSTATGSFDPIDKIAEFCNHENLWLHVDGAHGASTILSEEYKHLLSGIEKADSVVWDAHKMLMMPALVTAVLFRNGKDSYNSFHQQASYLFSRSPEEEWYNTGQRTLECTKSMMALKVYVCLMVYGEKFFARYVTAMTDLTRTFAGYLRETGKFEVPFKPSTNIICFRYNGADDETQALIRKNILDSGRFYFVQTNLRGKTYLRCTVINPLTTINHLKELAAEVEKTASKLIREKKAA